MNIFNYAIARAARIEADAVLDGELMTLAEAAGVRQLFALVKPMITKEDDGEPGMVKLRLADEVLAKRLGNAVK